ncbi:hypothetical protein OENI_540007 [Oenococcus oeni]|nr:hypothetical protein OENI_540007 [Oenococcus oeni]
MKLKYLFSFKVTRFKAILYNVFVGSSGLKASATTFLNNVKLSINVSLYQLFNGVMKGSGHMEQEIILVVFFTVLVLILQVGASTYVRSFSCR